MEIQLTSFILGMSLVLVIAMAVVSVYTIVKVMKLKNETQGFIAWVNQEFAKLRTDHENQGLDYSHKIENTYRDMDSRLDKLYEKVMKTKSPKNEVFQMADESGFKETLLKVFKNEEEGNGLKNRILEIMNKEGKESSISK
jgi:trans-2-enoyl-CoA reductase